MAVRVIGPATAHREIDRRAKAEWLWVKRHKERASASASTESGASTPESRILFSRGSTALGTVSRQTVQQQAEWLKRRPGLHVRVEGHADDGGDRASDQRLSEMRAAIVRDRLVSHGVQRDRVAMIGYGRERPASADTNEAARAANRRTVTTIRNEDDEGSSAQ